MAEKTPDGAMIMGYLHPLRFPEVVKKPALGQMRICPGFFLRNYVEFSGDFQSNRLMRVSLNGRVKSSTLQQYGSRRRLACCENSKWSDTDQPSMVIAVCVAGRSGHQICSVCCWILFVLSSHQNGSNLARKKIIEKFLMNLKNFCGWSNIYDNCLQSGKRNSQQASETSTPHFIC